MIVTPPEYGGSVSSSRRDHPGKNTPDSVGNIAEIQPSRRRIRRLTSEEIEAYDLIPPELAHRVRIITIGWLPGPYAGMALGRTLVMSESVPPDGTSVLLAHELIHVRQWNELGTVGFLFRYLRDFLRAMKADRNWNRAYRRIGAETEARRLADTWQQRRTPLP